MSTAVTSGAAALLLQQRPQLKPDQVKRQLVGNTQPFGSTSVQSGGAAGAGLLDIDRATTAPTGGSANRGLRPTDAFARVLYPILYGQPLHWKDPNYLGRNWSVLTWATLPWDSITWDNLNWDDIAWDDIAWDDIAWDDIAWDD